ncbi:hypothetical protein AURDEDRAFT_112253 [Auricularia subglabra TFB-10046 SS5]|nr:hypothetical protein AURDEDRAFT_112253 [Auricularia subglabra TFB-10046 SS5]
MSDPNAPPTPADDAERIRLKRLAKLGNASATASSSSTPSGSAAPSPAPAPPRVALTPTPRKVIPSVQPVPTPPPAQARKPSTPAAPPKFDLAQWEHDTLGHVLNVTLDRDTAEREGWNVVWLKGLMEDLRSSDPSKSLRLDPDLVDQLLISRLELDPNVMSDDPEVLQIAASLPADQTVFEYLVACWKRVNAARPALIKKNYTREDVAKAMPAIDKLRELIISYVGLTLQSPDMFPQPSARQTGHVELVDALMKMSSFTGSLLSVGSSVLLPPGDIEVFIGDLGRRFEGDGLEEVLGPVVELVAWKNPALLRKEGLGGGDAGWRQAVSALEVLVSSKPVAAMITKLPRWCPDRLQGPQFEFGCLLGPLLRLHIMPVEWPNIADTYFSEPEKRTLPDIESSNASLRGTLVALQTSLFQIFNALVRASPESREAVLKLFSSALNANWKRSGSHVHHTLVATDSFFLNIYSVLLRFSEPFMDSKYSKLDRIDPEYLAHSTRVNVSEETKLNATSDQTAEWKKSLTPPSAPPNFITEIFYLTAAYSHLGFQRAIARYDQIGKRVGDIRRTMSDIQNGRQEGTEEDVRQCKEAISKYNSYLVAMHVQLLEPDMVFRTLTFGGFTAAWLTRVVEPTHTFPAQQIELPLPREVNPAFANLPEFFFEIILKPFTHLLQMKPDMINALALKEMLEFLLTFLTSTWYIHSPYIKTDCVQILFLGTDGWGQSRNVGVFSDLINTNPIALKHLMRTLLNFYVEVEMTGTHTQFWDKFNYRRSITHVLQQMWDNPVHRENLETVSKDSSFFPRLINLLMNDTTFALDESIGKLSEIYELEQEMANVDEWNARPENERNDKQSRLKQLQDGVPFFVELSSVNLGLFRKFTLQTRGPFTSGEIVERLAAMLAYNLETMAGPRSGNLKVKDMEKKYHFRPRELLAEIMEVFLNLSEEPEFVRAVANEGRSYSKRTFLHAAAVARRYVLKPDAEIEQFVLFVEKVEAMKLTIEEEDDVGEIPDEFLDPLMYTIMKDPVTLPSSKTNIDLATIKAHLLSDPSDPFNRVPLKIEDCVPNDELKARIQEFLREARRKKREAAAAQRQQEDQVMVDA